MFNQLLQGVRGLCFFDVEARSENRIRAETLNLFVIAHILAEANDFFMHRDALRENRSIEKTTQPFLACLQPSPSSEQEHVRPLQIDLNRSCHRDTPLWILQSIVQPIPEPAIMDRSEPGIIRMVRILRN